MVLLSSSGNSAKLEVDQTKVQRRLYPSKRNPLLIKPKRPLPKEIAVIGAGAIGPDIAYYFKSALPEIKIFLVDIVEDALKKAQNRINGYVKKALERKKITQEQAEKFFTNIIYTTDYSLIKNADLVVEAATENIKVKRMVFEQIEKIVSYETIITSNTSSIPADRIFLNMEKPSRATITHFFAPAWRNILVEVIKWDKVDQEVIDYLLWMFAATGKVPIVTNNVICFMLDRIFDNWCNEAAYLLDIASAKQIDYVAEEFVAAGPFYVLNMAKGNPIILEANTLQMEEGEHYRPAHIFLSVREWETNVPGTKIEVPNTIKSLVRDRLLGVLFSQSFDIIDRGIGTLEDLNFGCQAALGFRKGPFDIMRDIGPNEVECIINKFRSEKPGFPGPTRPYDEYQNFRRHILIDEMEGVKIITIRRPHLRNALSDEVNDEILSILKQYVDDPSIKGFIITGYGQDAFCAGAEIGRFVEVLGDREAATQYARECAKLLLFIDQIKKPVVAAVNGLALGGGLELAIRCHSIVAVENAIFQFPEVTLGILPGLGGCIVPYRKWPEGAKVFHEMLTLAKPITAKQAAEIGIVKKLTTTYFDMIQKAIEEVERLQNNISRIPDGKIEIPELKIPACPMYGDLRLSNEVVSIIARTIEQGANAELFSDALEIGYRSFGEAATTEAAKEGISAFLEKRQPNYIK
jgi:enoyl-CoA hydratase/3-hydroxyacyl-CoA dehydrogenase